MSPDRIKEVEGSINLRDFGGYLTSEGKRVTRDKLFRSGNLHFLTADGEAAFAGLNIGLVCDLRRADEKSREPTRVLTTKLEIPIDPGSAIEMRARLRDGMQPECINVLERSRCLAGKHQSAMSSHRVA